MNILVIDGQGGGIGKSIIEAVKKEFPDMFIVAVGTNSAATHNMKKAGADVVATGENAVVYHSTIFQNIFLIHTLPAVSCLYLPPLLTPKGVFVLLATP